LRNEAYDSLAGLWHGPSGLAAEEEVARLFSWLVDQERGSGASLEHILKRLSAGLAEAIRLELGALLAAVEGPESGMPNGPAER
jgi:hypothetical protein